MSNSSLVNYTKISPNRTKNRTHKIDTITIHCVVGQVTVERLGEIFAPTSRQASSNYGIGYDGKIGMYCEEKDRSWCSSNAANDHRAITIEVASDTKSPYAITDAAYKALVKLCADICKRNGIKKLLWKADKNLIGKVDQQNMTVHRWFANKSCPGDYIYSRLGKIAEEVNAAISPAPAPKPSLPAGQITSINGQRGKDVLVLITDGRASTGFNQYGTDIIFDGTGKITQVAKGKANTPIPKGSYCLSGHGINSAYLYKYKVGDHIKV